MTFESQQPALLKLGWRSFFRSQLEPEEMQGLVVARVVEPLRGLSRVACAVGEIWAECSESVAVGDWVIGSLRAEASGDNRLSINRILERQTKLSRTAPSGKRYEQILCANADFVFVVVAMTQALNVSAVERAIAAAKSGGIVPVLILTKSDACDHPSGVIDPIAKILGGVAMQVISVPQKINLESLRAYFGSANTVVLLGASGAGKSTLTNFLIESKAQLVSETRERDQKGRHTTTARRMHFLPSGGMIVDSPGIRELQLWAEPELRPKGQGSRPARSSKRFRQGSEDDDD